MLLTLGVYRGVRPQQAHPWIRERKHPSLQPTLVIRTQPILPIHPASSAPQEALTFFRRSQRALQQVTLLRLWSPRQGMAASVSPAAPSHIVTRAGSGRLAAPGSLAMLRGCFRQRLGPTLSHSWLPGAPPQQPRLRIPLPTRRPRAPPLLGASAATRRPRCRRSPPGPPGRAAGRVELRRRWGLRAGAGCAQ